MMPPGRGLYGPRGTVSRIYKEDNYTLLHTKYGLGPCGFGEEDFFYVFPMTPRVGACIDPRGTVVVIYKKDHYILLHTKYKSSWPCGFGEEEFVKVFPIVSLWELMTPRAWPLLTPGTWLA